MKMYLVGGAVRDSLLKLPCNDMDYSVEMIETLLSSGIKDNTPLLAYAMMNNMLKEQGFKIFLETPDCFTTRAQFPSNHKHSGVADFVMCRKEIGYIPGTRKPIVELGTLLDDLTRRDFTINAIARDVETGELIDPFNGQEDLKNKILRCPINAVTSFNNDPLRVIRALRFKIMKGLSFHSDVSHAIDKFPGDMLDVVSVERIREELYKMFRWDTAETLKLFGVILERNPSLWDSIFNTSNLWLVPTIKYD